MIHLLNFTAKKRNTRYFSCLWFMQRLRVRCYSPQNEDREHLAMIPTIPCCLALAKLQYLFIFSVVGVWALKELDWEKCSYIQTLAPRQYLWRPIFVMFLCIFMNVNISMKSHRDSYLLSYYWELLKIKTYCMAQQTNPDLVPYVWFPKCTSHFTTGSLNVITESLG